MKPLILTSWPLTDFVKSGPADLATFFYFRFVWGQLPSTDELAAYLGPRSPIMIRAKAATGRTSHIAGGEAETKAGAISTWPNSAGFTRPSNFGSTRAPKRN